MKPRIALYLSLFLFLGVATFGQAPPAASNIQPPSAADFIRGLAEPAGINPAPTDLAVGGDCNLDCVRWANACNSLLTVCDKTACIATCPCGNSQSCRTVTESVCFTAGYSYSILLLGVGLCQRVL